MSTSIERVERKQAERIAAMAKLGATANRGQYQGAIELSATQAGLLLQAVDRRDKLIAALEKQVAALKDVIEIGKATQ